jgi:hypothetical protein
MTEYNGKVVTLTAPAEIESTLISIVPIGGLGKYKSFI